LIFEAGVLMREEGKDEAIMGEMGGVNRIFEDLLTGKHSQYVFEH
jgi:hypothetical protein